MQSQLQTWLNRSTRVEKLQWRASSSTRPVLPQAVFPAKAMHGIWLLLYNLSLIRL
jgi:hypothetical protein